MLMSSRRLYGPHGLMASLAAACQRPGFLALHAALETEPQPLQALRDQVKQAAGVTLDDEALREHLEILASFDFVCWYGPGLFKAELSPNYEGLVLNRKPELREGH
jgi:hypothetical protein